MNKDLYIVADDGQIEINFDVLSLKTSEEFSNYVYEEINILSKVVEHIRVLEYEEFFMLMVRSDEGVYDFRYFYSSSSFDCNFLSFNTLDLAGVKYEK